MPGQIVHIEIPADDTAKEREFWGSLFGWTFESFPGPSEYHMTRISEQTGAAITNMEPGKRGMRPYFDVDDINAGAVRVKELEARVNAVMNAVGDEAVRKYYRQDFSPRLSHYFAPAQEAPRDRGGPRRGQDWRNRRTDWHKHDKEDEFFYVVEGRFVIELEGRRVELTPRQGLTVPKGMMHRTGAPERTVILMIEGAGVKPTGD